ncbi:MAG: hypothetical protein Q4D81_14215, partial [Eubacteriales bacterium]|nr:hypothetical protein [Eubacteriales bacterium]
MDLHKVEKIEKAEEVIYLAVYSDGKNSVQVAFGLQKENGSIYDIDNPVIDLDGKQYVMPRPLRKNDYTIDACSEHYIK